MVATKTKSATKSRKAKTEKQKRRPKPKIRLAPRKLSLLEAATEVLRDGQGTVGEILERIRAKGLWESDAATPQNTLSSAMRQEISKKGAYSRFRLVSPGVFGLAH